MSTPDPDEAMGMADEPYTSEQTADAGAGGGAGPERGAGSPAGSDTATSAVGTGAAESDTSVMPGEGGTPSEGQ